MSRYLLIPTARNTQTEVDKLALMPMERITDQMKTVEIPHGISVPLPPDLDSDAARTLLIKLAKTGLHRSKDGLLIDGSKTLQIKFDDAIVDFCRGNFSDFYEDFYCILRKHGITF
jgi:hypothetical protein